MILKIRDENGKWTSIPAIQGQKGDPGVGLPGPAGEQGPKGEPFTYDDFTEEQLAALRGATGPAGNDGVSPVANVTSISTGAVITITDAKGTTTATVRNGTNGVDGAPGLNGTTPVKGTDYWTAADKQEIVNDVLNALPAAEGVSV